MAGHTDVLHIKLINSTSATCQLTFHGSKDAIIFFFAYKMLISYFKDDELEVLFQALDSYFLVTNFVGNVISQVLHHFHVIHSLFRMNPKWYYC
jgi:hypothetical protein